MSALTVGVLGPVRVVVDDDAVPITGPKARALVAMLALRANRPVPVDTLIDAVWGESSPPRAEHALQQHISGLRRLLEPRSEGPNATLVTASAGYELRVADLDAERFEALANAGFVAAEAGRLAESATALDAALGCWRGRALADARDSRVLEAAAVRLDEQRLLAHEARVAVRLQCGDAARVIPDIEQLVAEHPYRERLRAQLMLALYRNGRQADALAAYQDARNVLIEELGIEPGAELREAERAILRQDLALDADEPSGFGDLYTTFRAETRYDIARVVLPDGQSVLLAEGSALIGRDPAAHVRLVDNRVSRHHARLETREGRHRLCDAGSTNGTTVNGARITEHELSDGDVIGVGGVELRFWNRDRG